jgi:hypothetical protein
MLWIDDVLNDLHKFCDDHGYAELVKKIEETREIYRLELANAKCIEFPTKSGIAAKGRPPEGFSEHSREFQKGPGLVNSKP